MKIVVAGGTGFLGRHIVASLLDAGHDVTVMSRSPRSVEAIPLLHGARAVQGDVTRPPSLARALEGTEAVVCAVQFPNYPIEQPRRRLTFDRYDRMGTENLLVAARKNGAERFVYMSGVNVHPNSDKSWYRAKGRAEVSVRESGIGHAIIRPSWAYGPEDRALNRFRAIAKLSPLVPKPGASIQRIQPVYVEDVALAVRRLFEKPDAWDRIYEIGGPDALTMDEVMRGLFEAMGVRRVIVPVPTPLMKLATAPLVVLPKPPLSPKAVEFAVQDGLADNAEVVKVLDVHPVSLREGLSRYVGRS